MEINKQLFEDVLSGKLKGKFVLRNGDTYFSADLYRNINKAKFTHPYIIGLGSYTPEGIFFIDNTTSKFDIIDFIPDTDMKENELTIEIPDGKIVDWDESKKQNKIVLKDNQLTYEDVCKKLFQSTDCYYICGNGKIVGPLGASQFLSDANNATTSHQLECILAKNKLANCAKYLNNGWKPNEHSYTYYINNYHGYLVVYLCCGEMSVWVGQIIFKSKELAQQAIEILGEETVKLALEPLGF